MGDWRGVRGWTAVAVVAGVVAGLMAGVTGARAWVSGPSVNLGSNPLKSFSLTFGFTGPLQGATGGSIATPASPGTVTKDVYEVPQGQSLIVTGMWYADGLDSATFTPGAGYKCQSAGGAAMPFAWVGLPGIKSVCLLVNGEVLSCEGAGLNEGIVVGSGAKLQLQVIGPTLGVATDLSGKPAINPNSCTYVVGLGGHLVRN